MKSISVLLYCLFFTPTSLLTQAEKNGDLKTFLSYYEPDVISMPEYQPTLHSIQELEAYYKEIFKRQRIKSFDRKAEEYITLGSTIIEIGTFVKTFDTVPAQNGKYWLVWHKKQNGTYKIKAEVYGYFHPIKDPKALTVSMPVSKLHEPTPLELRAYDALNEKYVRLKDGALRSEFYTEDARYMPFQEPTVSGKEIRPYLIEYSKRGDITFDSLDLSTIHSEYFPGYVLEYSEVKVKWSAANASGRTEGKGIRLWKRQADQSLKIYRHIGTHNYLN
jgi:ketosteroid isomerase-like protein